MLIAMRLAAALETSVTKARSPLGLVRIFIFVIYDTVKVISYELQKALVFRTILLYMCNCVIFRSKHPFFMFYTEL